MALHSEEDIDRTTVTEDLRAEAEIELITITEDFQSQVNIHSTITEDLQSQEETHPTITEYLQAQEEIHPTITEELQAQVEIQPTTIADDPQVKEESEPLLDPGHFEVEIHSIVNSERAIMEDLPNAVKLQDLGVNLRRLLTECLVEINLTRRDRGPMIFPMLTLQIPRIEIKDDTESLIRNMMALEQCHYPSEAYICSYIKLLNSLIYSACDVDLLIEKGIIKNSVGDSDVIIEMFNKLCHQIPKSDYCYAGVLKDLRPLYDSRWKRIRARLQATVFRNIFKILGAVVSFIAFLLYDHI
ncbi:hypothetical protein Pint_11882 [Pistacia integerrima]|uniref:Uncharacterized protein n=2 Tax=Pistacia TaxID=55512 RepID=A0ACC1A318_9ROSI|nr:hypothetical protein Pint_11882 [Pistacia integerrima]KAJ0080826.1 hypothetical protein Patl1_12040 [Pistacia atlantica]